MRALVTGGGGFLGKAIVNRLLEKGYRVRSFSRGRHPELENLGVETVQGDLSEAESVAAASTGCDVVFHVAAKAGIWGPYQAYYSANVTGTVNVLKACKSQGVRSLIYTSSPSVVFDGKDMEGANESVPYPRRYKSPYPETKAAAERLVLASSDSRFATVALRPHLIWGPGDTHLVPGIIARARQGRLRRVGSTAKLVDFTYIDEAARAHVQAADRLLPGSTIAGRAFFVSQGRPMPLWDFVNRVLRTADLPAVDRVVAPSTAYLAGCFCEICYKILPLKGDPPMTRFLAEELSTAHWFDISAARQQLGFEPQISMAEGFERLREWLQRGPAEPAE